MLPKKNYSLKDKHAEQEIASGATGEKVNEMVPVRAKSKKPARSRKPAVNSKKQK